MAKDHDWHDWHSDEYVAGYVERARREAASGGERLDLLADLIPFGKDDPITVLDVGGGFGRISAVVLEGFPNARVTLHDYAEPMLARARTFLAPYADRVQFVKADLFSTDWLAAAGGPSGQRFDAVVSAIALHNLQDSDRLREIYREIYGVLNDGGCFLSLDIVNAASREMHLRYGKVSHARRQRTIAAAERRGETVEIRRGSGADGSDPLSWEWPPFPASVGEQIEWLRDAGFSQVDCFWKDLGNALVGGFK